MALPWTYVNQLDQLIGKLTFVYREAKAVGGDDAAHNVIGRIWPSGKATTEGGDPSNRQNRQQQRAPHGSPSIPLMKSAPRSPTQAASGTLASLLQRLGGGRTHDDTTTSGVPATRAPEQGPEPRVSARQGQRIEEEQESRQPPSCRHAEPKGPEAEPKSGAPEATVGPERPASAELAGSLESVAADPDGAAVPAPQDPPQPRPTPATSTARVHRASEMDRALLHRLLNHERQGRTSNPEPLSST
jgi:hypothetical protein